MQVSILLLPVKINSSAVYRPACKKLSNLFIPFVEEADHTQIIAVCHLEGIEYKHTHHLNFNTPGVILDRQITEADQSWPLGPSVCFC